MNKLHLMALLAGLALIWPARIAGQQRIEYRMVVAGQPEEVEREMNELAAVGFRFAAGLDRIAGGFGFRGRRLVVMLREEGLRSATRYKVFRSDSFSHLRDQLIEAGEAGWALLALEPNARGYRVTAYCEKREAD